MYSHVDHSRIKTLLRPIFSVFLIFTLYFNIFTTAHAGAAEKWEIVENVYDATDQKVNVTARKITQEAANSGTYKVKVPVTSSALGATAKTMLWTGVATVALEALIGAVGWIIDEGSKTIKKLDPEQPPNPPYIWTTGGWTQSAAEKYAQSANLFANLYCNAYGRENCTASNFVINSLTSVNVDIIDTDRDLKVGTFTITRTVNPDYDPNVEPRYIPVSDQELGDEIMGNGTEPNSRTTPETGIITQAYDPNNPVGLGEPAPKATDDALNSVNPEPDTPPKGESETKTETDPQTGETTEKSEFTLPNFCSWAPAVCDFFKVQKQDNKEIKQNQKDQLEQDKTFFEKVEEWFDWSKDESGTPDEPDTPEITELDIGQLDTSTFQATAGCPAPIEVPVNIGSGGNVEISYEPICQFAEKWSFVAPLIGFLSGAMILVGVGRKGEDGEL